MYVFMNVWYKTYVSGVNETWRYSTRKDTQHEITFTTAVHMSQNEQQ